MRIAEVIGSVTLGRCHPSLMGGSYRLAVPLTLDNLTGASSEWGEELVVYDDRGAGVGTRIAVSEGGEAAQPFEPEMKPIDAYNAAILDTISVQKLSS
jgi:ethanolamine utilization protein EutN